MHTFFNRGELYLLFFVAHLAASLPNANKLLNLSVIKSLSVTYSSKREHSAIHLIKKKES